MCDDEDLGNNGSYPYTYEQVDKIAQFLRGKTNIQPKVGLIAGTGLGNVIELLTETTVIDYSEIPGFPVSTVQGHGGKLHFGHIGPTPIVCMQGRFHFFEGYPLWKCVLPVRVMKLLGISVLVLSNAAGGIDPNLAIGDIMLIRDHINFVAFAGHNPLRGPNEEKFGPRFVAINDAYDKDLLKIARDTAEDLKIRAKEGVYACLGGPNFETVAELKALKLLGADAVGMSTVHEVITARHCGVRCVAFSLITNKCPMDYDAGNPDHQEILDVGEQKEADVQKFVEHLFKNFAEQQVA